jgi:hypothetical protein
MYTNNQLNEQMPKLSPAEMKARSLAKRDSIIKTIEYLSNIINNIINNKEYVSSHNMKMSTSNGIHANIVYKTFIRFDDLDTVNHPYMIDVIRAGIRQAYKDLKLRPDSISLEDCCPMLVWISITDDRQSIDIRYVMHE